MIDLLATAIKTAYDANTTLAAAPLRIDRQPPGSTGSYTVVSYPHTAGVKRSFDRTHYQAQNVVFKISTTSDTAAGSLQRTLHSVFDETSLSLASGRCRSFLRLGQSLRRAGSALDTDQSGDDRWEATSIYRAELND